MGDETPLAAALRRMHQEYGKDQAQLCLVVVGAEVFPPTDVPSFHEGCRLTGSNTIESALALVAAGDIE